MNKTDKIKIGIVSSLGGTFLILILVWMLVINKTVVQNEWLIIFTIFGLIGNVVVFILLTSKKVMGLYLDIVVTTFLAIAAIVLGTYLSATMAFIVVALECYGIYRWRRVKEDDVTDFKKKKIGKLTINWHYFIIIAGTILAISFGFIEYKFISTGERTWYADVVDGMTCIAGIVTFSVAMFKNKYSFVYSFTFHILCIILFSLIISENWNNHGSIKFWSALISLANYICVIILDIFGIVMWKKANTEKIG